MARRFWFRLAPVLPSLASRSSGHRAQLGGARSAREAALRKRLPSPLEKRCFSSASQTGQPAFWQGVLAIHGAALPASTGPGLAIHGKAFRLSKAALLIGCADQPSPIHGAALLASIGPSLDIHVEPFVRPPSTARWRSVCARSCASQTLALAPRKAMLFVCFADRATCILARCACHPWRGASGFDWSQSRHPCRAVRPSKSDAFRLLRRPGLTLPRTPAVCCPGQRRLAAMCFRGF